MCKDMITAAADKKIPICPPLVVTAPVTFFVMAFYFAVALTFATCAKCLDFLPNFALGQCLHPNPRAHWNDLGESSIHVASMSRGVAEFLRKPSEIKGFICNMVQHEALSPRAEAELQMLRFNWKIMVPGQQLTEIAT